MRLTEHEREVIVTAIARRFGSDARAYLFGSRTDDGKRGGDIDLFVETTLSSEDANLAKLRAITDMQLKLGERKIDLLVSPLVDKRALIYREIEREAIPL